MRLSRHAARPAAAAAQRLRAVRALPLSPDGATALLAASEDASVEVATAALRRLARCGAAGHAAALRERLFMCDLALVGEHGRALRALGGGDPDGVFSRALADERYEPRLRAAVALEILAEPTAADALRAATRDPVAGVRRAALDALRALGHDASSADAARAALADRDTYVRAAGVRALAGTSPARSLEADLARLARDREPVVRVEVARLLPRLELETGARLLTDSDPEVRLAALATARAAHRLLVAHALLADALARVRQAAARSLARLGEPTTAGALVAALGDADTFVRHAARGALVDVLGPAGAASALGDELAQRGPRRRRAALNALAALDVPVDVAALWPLVDDPSIDVRLALVRLAAATGERELLDALRADPHEAVRDAAERARVGGGRI
jgi:HEAT repeat protein